MPTYANPLYANGVPTYSNEVGALGEVFKALAPNPLRDLQIQGYANNARLHQLQGDVIANKQAGAARAADVFATDPRAAMVEAIRSDNPEMMGAYGKFNPAYFAAGAMNGNGPVDDSVLAQLVVGGGGDYGNTKPGFTANQDRQTLEANMKNDTTMRGQDMTQQSAFRGQDIGASTARRGQDLVNDRTIENNAQQSKDRIYNANLDFIKPSGRSAGAGDGSGSGGSSATGATELNPKGVEQLDSALANVLVGRAVPDADRADLAARTQAHYLAQPAKARNYQIAANQAVADIQAGADLDASTDKNLWSADDLMTKPMEQRAPMPAPWEPPPKVPGGGAGGLSDVASVLLQGNPDLSRPLSAAQLQQMPAPAAAPVAAPPAAAPGADLLTDAMGAISNGAPRDAVIQRLRSMGVSDQQIQAAGL